MQPLELPGAFQQKMQTRLGEEWDSFLNSYRNGRYRALRLHPDKRPMDLLARLGMDEKDAVPWARDAYYYSKEQAETIRPGMHPYHEMGLYYIQEPSAMAPAMLLDAQPGECVLDLCAAPGGKSTQIAADMMDCGLLVSNEIHPARARILSSNIERMGIGNAIVTNADSELLAGRLVCCFDRILVDAPCSGEGMFRKNPEAVTEWSTEHVRMCAERQRMILRNADRMLRPGGRLVYSTCTFSPEENEQVIAAFLDEFRGYSLLGRKELEQEWMGRNRTVCLSGIDSGRSEWANGDPRLRQTFRLWPHHLRGEGHFVAVLQKNTNAQEDPCEASDGFEAAFSPR